MDIKFVPGYSSDPCSFPQHPVLTCVRDICGSLTELKCLQEEDDLEESDLSSSEGPTPSESHHPRCEYFQTPQQGWHPQELPAAADQSLLTAPTHHQPPTWVPHRGAPVSVLDVQQRQLLPPSLPVVWPVVCVWSECTWNV